MMGGEAAVRVGRARVIIVGVSMSEQMRPSAVGVCVPHDGGDSWQA